MLAQAALGTVEAVAFLAPVLFVMVPLACGRFIGERRIARAIARRRRPAARRRPVAARRFAAQPRAMVVRGGRLIADSLAVRPPPAPAL